LSDLPRLLLCSFDVIPGPSGSSRRLTEYLKALPDRFSVVVLSAKTPDHSHIEKYQGARLLRVPVGAGDLPSRIQAFERAVRRQLESEEYALAHFTDPFGGYALCELKGEYGYRLIYEAQTFPSQELRYTHPQTEGDKRFLARIRRQELFCLMNADLVITGSQTTRTHIQSLGASTDQTRVIRAPVDLGPYTPDVLGVPDGQPMRLMYLGSQAGWQGLTTLVRALALAIEQGAEVKLTLVGPRHPDWQPHLEDLAKELGIQEHVEFQPPVPHDDLVKVMTLADVGVLPLDDVDRNRLQGGPLAKVSEYFAAGRPVIAADLPVTRELLPDSAVFFPAGDAKALADAITGLARDVARRVKLGREARAFAEQHLDAGLIRGQLLDIYDELLGKRPPAGTAQSELPEPTMTGTPTNRIPKYAPPDERRAARGGKSPASAASGRASSPSRRKVDPEDLPLVLGHALDDGLDTRLIKTEPDARPNEPPVVMGLPLRERAASADGAAEEPSVPTAIVHPPQAPEGKRDDPEEPPTAIVASPQPTQREDTPPAATPGTPPQPTQREATPPAATPGTPPQPTQREAASPAPTPGAPPQPTQREATPPSPTPVVRPPPAEAPPPLAARVSPSTLAEESDLPTGVVSLKSIEQRRGAGASRSEPASQPPPAAPPATGTREAPAQEPARAKEPQDPEPARTKEPQDKGRQPSLPPLSRSAPPPETRVPPPRLTPTETPPPLTKPSPPPPKVAHAPETPPPLIKRPAPPARVIQEEPEEIPEAEAQEISDEPALDTAPTPPHPRPRVEEPEEISNDEIQEADAASVEDADDQIQEADGPVEQADDAIEADDAVEPADDVAEPLGDEADEFLAPVEQPLAAAEDGPAREPPPSALDPWFAQLAHGYCPPEGAQFARHTPPTNFPGRDQDPTDPSRIPPASQAQGSSRGKSS
jgi:glycosyltransferase involved in cell wall biosynthesis